MNKKINTLFFILVVFFSLGFSAEYRLLKAERAEIVVSDNFNLVGSFYPVKEQNPPAVILLHMLGRNRGDWNVFARYLQKEGIAVLSLDLRGHGESTNFFKIYWRGLSGDDFLRSIPDLDAVFDYLRDKKINTKKIGILGVGMGANLAINYAVKNNNVQTLVLVDPGLNYQGVMIEQALDHYGERSLYVICNAQNDHSLEAARTIQRVIKGKLKIDTYNYGVSWPYLFNNQKELQSAVLLWFKETLLDFKKIDEAKLAPDPVF